MLTLDEIEFETPDEATLTLDDVQFDSQAAQTPARRPTSQPRKRLRTKIPGGKVTAEDLKVRVPRTQLLDRVLQGEELEIQGGDQVTTISNTPTSFDFQQPITELTTSTTPVRITPGRPRKQPDESVEAFVRRSKEFEDKQAQVEQRRKALRAQTRAKTLPSQGLEKYPTAIAQGVEGVLRPAMVAVAEWAGVEPPEWAKQENILPRLGEADAAEWGTKVATGLGSTIPQIPLGIATGGAGTIVLGALSNAGQTYEEAKAMGASDQDALAASVPGALIGSLEGVLGLGSGQLAGQLAKGTVKTFAGDVTKELFQELTNQALNNVNAKYVSGYDPQRSLTEGLWDTFTTTLPIAGGFNVGHLANGGLKRSGVEFSVGPLEQEKLGTTLYSGLDPSLIREYLPRPETLRKLFSQLFNAKQVGTLPEVSIKLSQLTKKLTSEASEKFTRTREDALDKFKSTFPESPDDWDVARYDAVVKEHWPAIESYMESFQLNGIFSPDTYYGEHEYPPANNYTVSSNYVPSTTDPGKYAIETVAKDSEGNTVATVISPGMYPSVRLDLATQIVKHDLANKPLGKPISNQTKLFLEKLNTIRDREKFNLEQQLDRDYRKITKYIYRWLDKQKYEMSKHAESIQLNLQPLETKITQDPQGIVVHKISRHQLENLLEKANHDLTKAKHPSPSIGIIHPEANLDAFGDIQLIATPSLVHETIESGTAYPADFYSPTVSEVLSSIYDTDVELTLENVDAISKMMVDQMRDYAENRLEDPGVIFDNNALFNSYAKAGGSWASKQELVKGLASLKAATSRSMVPEFDVTNEIRQKFTDSRLRLQDRLREAFLALPSQSVISEYDPQEAGFRFLNIRKTLNQYLLIQLSKDTFPSVEEFNTGLRNALIKHHPELGTALGKDADPNSRLLKALGDFIPIALETFQAFRSAPSLYMEVQPTRAIRLDEYVAALLPLDEGTATVYQDTADTLTNLGLKVYRYSNPEEKIAIQKALAQFKDLTINPDSTYGALYSNPIFNPDLWKSLLKVFRKEKESINLADYEHIPGSSGQTAPSNLVASRPIQFSDIPFKVTDKLTLKSSAVLNSPKVPSKMSAEQAAAILKEVKQEEKDWLGLTDAIERAKELGKPLTKDQLLSIVDQNKVELREMGFDRPEDLFKNIWEDVGEGVWISQTFPNFGKAIIQPTPEGKYRLSWTWFPREVEVNDLQTAFKQGINPKDWESLGIFPMEYSYYNPWSAVTQKSFNLTNPREVLFQVWQNDKNIAENFTSTHFYTRGEGLLAHARMWDGEEDDGKVLMLGEVQSDLHQAGRRSGYRLDVGPTQLELEDFDEYGRPVPETPFKQTWPELVFKRVISYAAENGYSKIRWPIAEDHIQLYYGEEDSGVSPEQAPKIYELIYDTKLPKLAKDFAKKYGAEYHTDAHGHILELSNELKNVAAGGKLPLFAERKDPSNQTSTKFSQPSARFYPGSASKGGTVYVNPQMASKFEDLPLSAGAFNLETKEFGKLVAKLPKDDPATQPLVEAFREAITKKLPSVNVVIHYEGSGPWARRLARHESFHRGQYLASQELLRSKGREHLFEPDIGTIHDPSLHNHPVVLKVESTLIGERIKSRYPDSYAKAALTFETAAYMASNDYKRFGVSPEDAANFVTDYLQSVAETAGVSGLSALIEGTRLSPSVEKIGKDILNASSIRDTRSPSRYLPGTASRAVAQLAESEDSPGRDPAAGLPENVESTTSTNLFEPVLRPEVVAESARRFRQLITDSGLQYDPKLPAHLNLAKAIGEGKLNLESLGLTPDDYAVFAKDLAQSASEYGRGLQAVGQTQIFYERLVKENPEQAKRLAEAGLSPQIARAALRTLRATQYGQSLWERMGALPRKMALTRLSTFWTNVWGTLGFLPLTILDGAITGLGLQALDPKRYSQDSGLSIAQKATKRIKEGMRPATNVLLAMTPKSLGAVLNRSTGMEKFDQVANELEVLHPDIYTKLHGVEHSTLKQETADVTVSLLREVLPLMPDGKERLEVEQKFKEIDRHQRFNKSLAGKAYGKTEWAYDYLLRPMTWQEYAFRRPFFVGALQRELAQEGLDLWDLVASGNLSAASRPAIEKAVDAALEFTWSYMPHERDHGVIEASTNTLIKSINKLGPVGFLVEAFPRAIYNGLKFWYEWGPWGGVTPTIKTISNLSKSRRDAIAYRDIQRISRAALGTILYGAALSLRSSAGGEEWWQLATGRKDSKGRPIYYNAKRIPQLAFFLWAADSAQRVAEQREVDKKFQQEGLELYASMRRTGSTEQLGAVDAFLDWWQEKDNSESAARGLARPAGQLLALPLTPFINVRDVWGQFSTDEAARKDLRDEPLTAPALDRLPWFRRRLPNFQSPTETGITPTSNDPLTTVAPGIVFDPGTSFAGREFARLGITPYHWLKRDASPKIDRAQFAMYSKILETLGNSLSQDPSYLQASDLEKAARWEALLAGPDGIAAIAREAGLAADPNEAAKRELRKAIPPLRRRANPALNDKIKSIGK